MRVRFPDLLIRAIIFLPVVGFGNLVRGEGELFSAEHAFLNGKYNEALTYYLSVNSSDLPPSIAIYNAGLNACLLGDTITAKALWLQAGTLDRKNPWPLYQLAQLALVQDRPSEALNTIDQAVALNNDIADFFLCRARALLILNRYREACEAADEALDIDPSSPTARVIAAKSYRACGQLDKALAILDEGLTRFPDSSLLIAADSIAIELGEQAKAGDYVNIYLRYYGRGKYAASLKARRIIESSASACDSLARKDVFRWLHTGIRYVYNGRWGPFFLGTLVVEVENPTVKSGMEVIPVSYRIKSNPALFIIKVNDLYSAWLNLNLDRTLILEADVNETWWRYRRKYEMDYDSLRLVIRVVEDDRRIGYLEQEMPFELLDGTSLLLHTRDLVRKKQGARTATLIDYNFVWTDVEFQDQTEQLEAAGRIWDSYRVSGKAGYNGVAGLSGGFEGWFSADNEAVPLKARFKIFIGSIVLTLEEVETISANESH